MLPGSLNLFSELDTADDSKPDERFPHDAGVYGQLNPRVALSIPSLAEVKDSWEPVGSQRSHGACGMEGAL